MTLRSLKRLFNQELAVPRRSVKDYPTKLNIGCGFDKKIDYLNVDIDPNCGPDLLLSPDGSLDVLPRLYFSEILARDVLEHFPRSQSSRNLLIWNELLIQGGSLHIVTTDVLSVASKMVSNMTYAAHHGWSICLFGNQVHPGDFHLTGFSDLTLEVLLSAAGFEVSSKGYIDEWCFDWTTIKVDSWSQFIQEQERFSDIHFLSNSYEKVFNRELDAQGRDHFSESLKKGLTRREVYLEIASSPEALFVKARALGK
jgi:hypothetical protein